KEQRHAGHATIDEVTGKKKALYAQTSGKDADDDQHETRSFSKKSLHETIHRLQQQEQEQEHLAGAGKDRSRSTSQEQEKDRSRSNTQEEDLFRAPASCSCPCFSCSCLLPLLLTLITLVAAYVAQLCGGSVRFLPARRSYHAALFYRTG